MELIGKCELEKSSQTTSIDLVRLAKDIRANVEGLREAELRRHRGWLTELPEYRRAHVEALSRNIINSILRQMLSELRRAKDIERAAEVARRLFGTSVIAVRSFALALGLCVEDRAKNHQGIQHFFGHNRAVNYV